MYKLQTNFNDEINSVTIVGEAISIPFCPANTDYAEFKKAVTAGAELQDASGNVMTPEAAQQYIETLP